ncbi:hypothetical protein [Methanobacterium paludis]|uniref:Uncharacterized protein n=1 Tax=Methanobacterium paludis (strain DSM 25820 / JCM 18151 / SWAN1) TaxID=868131 RepID=F6D2Q9_METPW|nr:hypothetical protein [Methanobacterium paludis]AEG18638.1 hypothetical protein MSWAN_1627 [Methanobacterium paludis]
MNKTQLTNVIKRYCDNKDFEGAKNYVHSFGPQIKNFDVDKELEKIDKLIKGPKKPESKPEIKEE